MILTWDIVIECAIALGLVLIPSIWIFIAFSPHRNNDTAQWYDKLKKPAGTPALWIIDTMWVASYVLTGVAVYIMYESFAADPRGVTAGLILFGIQYIVSLTYSPIFYGGENLIGGVAVLTTILPLILWTSYEFFQVSALAAYLLIPYGLWIGFSIATNAQMAHANLALCTKER